MMKMSLIYWDVKKLVTVSHEWKKDCLWIFLFVTFKLFNMQENGLEHVTDL
jgi:hypothetical protein